MSEKLYIRGGNPLVGEVSVSGSKNSVLALIAATLLSDEPCRLENVPVIEDVRVMLEIVRYLGAGVDFDSKSGIVDIDPRTLDKTEVPQELSGRLRASYYFLGALYGARGEAKVGLPGGCSIGERKMDLHLMAFNRLGAQIDENDPTATAIKGIHCPGKINFDKKSVGATMNAMLAAAKIEGKTTITNIASEPHISDLGNFLRAMGAQVRDLGNGTMQIFGKKHLRGFCHSIIPDQIETGTLMIATAATRGEVRINNCIPEHMEALSAKLLEMGVSVTEDSSSIVVKMHEAHRAVNVFTREYPGFPTDLQQPISALLTRAKGKSEVTENIFNNRFGFLDEMRRMGARFSIYDNVAVIEGVDMLKGTYVKAQDLRGGAALVIAGLMAEGATTIENPHYIRRGYEGLEIKLKSLGADIYYGGGLDG